MGNEVSTAYDGVEGLALAESLHPEVVILDLGTPRWTAMTPAGRCA